MPGGPRCCVPVPAREVATIAAACGGRAGAPSATCRRPSPQGEAESASKTVRAAQGSLAIWAQVVSKHGLPSTRSAKVRERRAAQRQPRPPELAVSGGLAEESSRKRLGRQPPSRGLTSEFLVLRSVVLSSYLGAPHMRRDADVQGGRSATPTLPYGSLGWIEGQNTRHAPSRAQARRLLLCLY